MRTSIRKITDSFQDCNYDMETSMTDWIIYFWNDDFKFFFELPNTKKEIVGTPKAKIYTEGKWIYFEDDNIDNLIIKIKEIYGEKV
jgi:hypothetical protein